MLTDSSGNSREWTREGRTRSTETSWEFIQLSIQETMRTIEHLAIEKN